ncbi:MAG: hypothetical protein LC777_06025 [Actinobacteria bacterium]|nr:hypothetical protein [Actinomycetota bacterium]
MPDVSSTAPAEVTTWVALDVHKHSIVAAILPASGGEPRLRQIEYDRASDPSLRA